MKFPKSSNMSVKIVMIEDHDEFRESLTFLLNSNDEFICTSYAQAEEAMAYIDIDSPEAIIMDINLPGISGIECTRILKLRFPSIQILMCTVSEDDDKILEALKAGASGYILKRSAVNDIFSAIKDIVSGGSPMTPVIARKVVASFLPKQVENNIVAILSVRENEILDLLAEGYRIKEIAARLYVTVNTIRTHIRHIYEKLQVNSRVEALNKSRKNIYKV